jgi:CheY-like chemotaxis protein
VLGFAQQAGGEIRVTSAPGEGAVFALYLPCAEADAAPHAQAALPEQNAQAPGAKVLVVEDSDILGEMTCEMLGTLGYRAVWASNAAAALALLGTDGAGFAMVFSDVAMPGMNGIEFAQQVRLRYPGLPVVLTSGYNAVMAEEKEHGFDLVLKPYTLDTLARAFGKALAGKAGKVDQA